MPSMALPSFSAVWSSRCTEEEKSSQSEFFLFGSRNVEEKTSVPTFRANPNFRWFCDGSVSTRLSCCERNFASEDQLQHHRKGHVKCYTKDCEFEAHPDVVEKHFSLQHRNSLYKKLCLTNKPEDIEKWILERKKNFPTKDRIVAKKEAEEKRKNRGEVIEKKSFGMMRRGRGRGALSQERGSFSRGGRGNFSRGRGSFSRGGRGNFSRGRGNFSRGRGMDRLLRGRGGAIRTANLDGLAYERPGEDPLACLPDFGVDEEKEKEAIDDEDDDKPVEVSSKVAPVVSGPALSLIASCYDSSDEEEEENEKEKAVVEEMEVEKPPSPEDPRPPPPPPSVELRGRDPVLRLVRRREICMQDRRRLLTRPRLLEMLLARDIQHERNVLMQCCYFINSRSFFGRCKDLLRKEEEGEKSPLKPTVPSMPVNDEVWEGEEVL